MALMNSQDWLLRTVWNTSSTVLPHAYSAASLQGCELYPSAAMHSMALGTSQPVGTCPGSRTLQGLWATRGQQGAASSCCHSNPVFAMVCCAQLPGQPKDHCRWAVKAGQGQGGWEGNWQREKCRMSKYVCMGQGKKETLAKDTKKDRS